jgi:hypothetical protein
MVQKDLLRLIGDDLIEALECLKAWWENGLVLRH